MTPARKDGRTRSRISKGRDDVQRHHLGCPPTSCWTLTRLLGLAILGLSLSGCSSGSGQATAAPAVARRSVTLTWEAGPSPVSGYVVYRLTNPTGSFSRLAITLAGVTQYTDTSVVPGQTYSYFVTSFDSANEEGLPSDASWVTVPTF
jgi:hypothetical protein